MVYGPELSKKTLIDRITLYREQNSMTPIEYLPETLENYWCGLPENVGKCESTTMPLGILAVLRGGIAVLKNYMYKSFISQEAAELRAKQCAGCKYNTLGDKSWADHLALHSVGGKRTAQYDRLGKCDVCNCALNMKVFYDGKVSKPSPEQLDKYNEVSCWQLEIIE